MSVHFDVKPQEVWRLFKCQLAKLILFIANQHNINSLRVYYTLTQFHFFFLSQSSRNPNMRILWRRTFSRQIYKDVVSPFIMKTSLRQFHIVLSSHIVISPKHSRLQGVTAYQMCSKYHVMSHQMDRHDNICPFWCDISPHLNTFHVPVHNADLIFS